MLTKYKKQIKVIAYDTAEGFEAQFNRAMSLLADKNVSVEDPIFNTTMGHCAYIVYNEPVNVAENIEDEFALCGEHHYCRECIYHQLPDDNRVKRVHCKLHEGLLRGADTPCCEEFLNAMAEGRTDFLKPMGEI